MQLFGSNTSPYARRIRMLIAHHNLNISYQHLDIFNEQDRATLIANNPARKIPFLIDGEHKICDSNLIHRYLSDKFSLEKLSYWQENQLVQINACNDSLIELLLCSRSDFDIQSDSLFFNLQRERIDAVLTELNTQCTKSAFLDCDYLKISLYCLLDWIEFRSLSDFSHHSELVKFLNEHHSLAGSSSSNPRN